MFDWCEEIDLLSHRPETLEEVAPVTLSPPDDVIPFIICEAEIRPSWADSSQLHCNACKTRNKFKRGGYYAHYGDGYIYIVGPDCGSENSQANVARARNAYEKRMALRFADENINDFKADFNEWKSRLRSLESFFRNAERARGFYNCRQDYKPWDSLCRTISLAFRYDGGAVVEADDLGHDRPRFTIRCADIFGMGKDHLGLIRKFKKFLGVSFRVSFDLVEFDPIIDEETGPQLSKTLTEFKKEIETLEKRKHFVLSNIVSDVYNLNNFANWHHVPFRYKDGRFSYLVGVSPINHMPEYFNVNLT